MLIIFIFLALIGRRICKPSHLLLLLLLLLLLIYSGGRPWHLEAVTSALAPFQPVKCNNGRRIRFKRNKRKEIEINGRAYASTCTLGFPIEIINELVQVEWMLRRWFGMWPRGSGGASGSGSGGGGGSRSLRRLNVPFSKDSLNCDYAKWFAWSVRFHCCQMRHAAARKVTGHTLFDFLLLIDWLHQDCVYLYSFLPLSSVWLVGVATMDGSTVTGMLRLTHGAWFIFLVAQTAAEGGPPGHRARALWACRLPAACDIRPKC